MKLGLTCFMLLSLLPSTILLQNTVFIDPARGQDLPECLTSNSQSSSPCASLTWVFQNYRQHSTHYILSQGIHTMTENSPHFKNLKHLAFTGNSSIVQCTQKNIGLAFINVTNITIVDVTIRNCSALRNSSINGHRYGFYVSVYFHLCGNISITAVTITKSPNARAVVMYDTLGSNVIEKSAFTFNRLENPIVGNSGGGGVYMEWTNCEYKNQAKLYEDGKVRFLFHNVTLADNKAMNSEESDYIIPHQGVQSALGEGGGLAIVFKGNATDISIGVTDSRFERNEATWGSGLLVVYQDLTNNNSISVHQTFFSCNGVLSQDTSKSETAGGGVRAEYYVHDSSGLPATSQNKFLLDECTFSNNHALMGGGISMLVTRQIVKDVHQLLDVKVQDTTFEYNRARIGAAVECSLFPFFLHGQLPLVVVSDSQFIRNSISDQMNTNSIRKEGVGTFYTSNLPIQLQNNITFTENEGSALAFVGTFVNFSNADATFTGNKGKYGGALNLLGSAFFVVNNFTVMKFMHNQAAVKGGAIANSFIEQQNFKSYPNCFVRHINPFLKPDDWGATLTFINNNGRLLGDSIYSTSLHPCALGSGERVLCWRGWEYYLNDSRVNCRGQILTDEGSIWYHTSTGNSKNGSGLSLQIPSLRRIPGEEFRLPLVVRDDLGRLLSNDTVFSASVVESNVSQVDPRYRFASGEHIRVNGVSGNNITLLLQTDSRRAWQVEVEVHLLKCPPGLFPSNDPPLPSSSCECDIKRDFRGLVTCSQQSTVVYIRNGYWMGKIEEYNDYVVSLCLPGFCNKADGLLKRLSIQGEDLEEEICGRETHRRGILCGECREGFGAAINIGNPECIACNNTSTTKNIVKYVFSLYFPLLAMFVFIIVFSVRLTSAPANAFIFYAQVVSSTFDLSADRHIPIHTITSHSHSLLLGYRLPYGLFNLDFLETLISPLCVSTSINALDILLMEYLIALFPLSMILVVVFLIKIKNIPVISYCFRFSFRNSSVKFLRHWKAHESLLHAFSAFLLLSYTKFSLTSSYLVNVHPFYAANGSLVGERRAYYAGQYRASDVTYLLRYYIPACIVLVLITLPPLILFGYPVLWFEKCISKVPLLWRWYPADKVQIFLDTFQGCYKDNRRFFAGMYFAFRLIINVIYILADTWLQQFVAQQIACTVFIFIIAFLWPYRNAYVNYVDLLIFTNLAVVNAISLYLFVFSQINSQQVALPAWPFTIQYILVFLPLIYMIFYVAWYLLTPSQKKRLIKISKIPVQKIKKIRRDRYLRSTLMAISGRHTLSKKKRKAKRGAHNGSAVTTTEITLHEETGFTDSSLSINSEISHDSFLKSYDSEENLEAILERAQTLNTYRSATSGTNSSTPYQQYDSNDTGF